MNCFVIMPFSKEFDDVYATIKVNVEKVLSSRDGRCFRLDEARPAGPITDRLLREIQSSAFCVADVTGNIPNVMWEVGYAMALGKPVIVITQKVSELPFDIKDLQALEYDRSQVSRTLGEPLHKMVLDTIQTVAINKPIDNTGKDQDELVGALLEEIKGLKSMLGSVVKSWDIPKAEEKSTVINISNLEGAWVGENGSHYYAEVIDRQLLVSYCYTGNDELTGVFYDWKKTGDYWFSKFAWIEEDISGFAFLKQDSIDSMVGAWWGDEGYSLMPDMPPETRGVSFSLKRHKGIEMPKWALSFFERVQKVGLSNLMTQRAKKLVSHRNNVQDRFSSVM